MYTIRGRNVNTLYSRGLVLLQENGVQEDTRNGPVIAIPEPVTSVYDKPKERVLFDARRDANPFFHLAEAIWMLSGSRDARILDRWVSDFSSRFAEKDGNAHGAYGHRWRQHWGDQLLAVGKMLRDDPTTRRAVLNMWDPDSDLGANKRDIPCNQQVFFRTTKSPLTPPDSPPNELSITVTCRSNDMFWGAYGANAVHFSILGEIVAGLAELEFRKMYQVSNNFHLYRAVEHKVNMFSLNNPYVNEVFRPKPLLVGEAGTTISHHDAENFLRVCESWTTYIAESGTTTLEYSRTFPASIKREPWFEGTFFPMMITHDLYKQGKIVEAMEKTESIQSVDWRVAALDWLTRRAAKKNIADSRTETR